MVQQADNEPKFVEGLLLRLRRELSRTLVVRVVPELVEGNGNYGQRRHHYYEQNIYKNLFKEIWDKLRGRNIVRKSLADIENSQVFKY